MDNKPQQTDGEEVAPQEPTLEDGMSPSDETLETTEANQSEEQVAPEQSDEAQDPLRVLKAAGINASTEEEAIQKLKNLNSLVGDQRTAKERKIAENLMAKTGLRLDELVNELDAGGNIDTTAEAGSQTTQSSEGRAALDRATRLEVKDFTRDVPEAKLVFDSLFNDVKATGKLPEQIWEEKYKPLLQQGQESGAKKLQTKIKEQPTRGISTAGSTSTSIDFNKPNPSTGRPWTYEEMEKYLPKE